MTDIWPLLFGTLLSVVVMYVGFINKMRSQISVLEEKVKQFEKQCDEVSKRFNDINNQNAVLDEKTKRIESRQDSHSKRNDEIVTLITDFKLEVVKMLGSVKEEVSKLSSDVDNINQSILFDDEGVVKKRRKNK
jgi:chromosome segregation ATPase